MLANLPMSSIAWVTADIALTKGMFGESFRLQSIISPFCSFLENSD
jgi:hypothetical protein